MPDRLKSSLPRSDPDEYPDPDPAHRGCAGSDQSPRESSRRIGSCSLASKCALDGTSQTTHQLPARARVAASGQERPHPLGSQSKLGATEGKEPGPSLPPALAGCRGSGRERPHAPYVPSHASSLISRPLPPPARPPPSPLQLLLTTRLQEQLVSLRRLSIRAVPALSSPRSLWPP